MQDDAGFYAPLQYQPQWFWAGLLIVVVVGAWYAWIFRPIRRRPPAGQGPPQQDLDALRSACLAAINATAEDADAGRIPVRDAHQRLSFLVREFAGAATGLPVTSMTLEDLRRQGLEELAEGIAGIYPNEFSRVPIHPVGHSAETARQVVIGWN
ncbi:hypothetical protein QEH68_12015 [Paenarthrobacter sp. OM7]|uniref:hypothetical protein n=1 Tax=Paenarthrobacter sp. OM7 TaxID=3041264 RepID=UPI002468B9EF|nr:hypothetical protein [Paenarthrobacter sp. OM7]WGM18783.1 hypothetical protein QEH68_12015 [Paenarthrobacter sp. OM7]